MKKRNILAAVKATACAMTAALILTASVGSAWSYFTTYTSASGSHAIDLGNETRVVERFSDSTKGSPSPMTACSPCTCGPPPSAAAAIL